MKREKREAAAPMCGSGLHGERPLTPTREGSIWVETDADKRDGVCYMTLTTFPQSFVISDASRGTEIM